MAEAKHLPWCTNPAHVMERAKAHAMSQLDLKHPKLTALERAYFIAFKRRSLHL